MKAWDVEEAAVEECSIDELCQKQFANKLVEVWGVPHIIGQGGHVIRRIKAVCGVSLIPQYIGDGKHEILNSGARLACI